MNDITQMNTQELVTALKEKREQIRKIRFGTAGSGMRNTREIRTLRRDVARLLTNAQDRDTQALQK